MAEETSEETASEEKGLEIEIIPTKAQYWHYWFMYFIRSEDLAMTAGMATELAKTYAETRLAQMNGFEDTLLLNLEKIADVCYTENAIIELIQMLQVHEIVHFHVQIAGNTNASEYIARKVAPYVWFDME